MADYKGLNIKWEADGSEASKALHLISADAKAAQGNLNAVQGALSNVTTNGKALNDELRNFQLANLNRAMDDAAKKARVYSELLPQLRDRQSDLRKEIDDTKDAIDTLNGGAHFGDVSKSIRDLEAHLNSLEEQERKAAAEVDNTNQKMLVQESKAQALSAAYQSLSANMAASQTGMGQFGADAKKAGESLSGIGDAISNVGDKMTVVSGIAALTFGRNVISSTEEFGNAIAQLGGYLEIEGSSLEHMSDLALKWGKDTQFSATEAADAMNELAKGGMTQAQIEGGAMEATMQLAAAGELSMADAASVAVQAIKTFNLDAADASMVADALAGAATKSTAEVSELANGFKYVGGWASMAGWNINEVSGALALLSDHGLQSEMAGTALRNVMQRLAAPTDKAAELMQAYGFSVRDAQGHMVSATEMVERLDKTFGNLADEEKQSVLNEIFGARALPAAIALMNDGADALQEYIDATNDAGYASEMAKTRMGDLGWALEYMRGEAETAAVNFGNALAPTIIDVAKKIEGAATWFNELSDSEKTGVANMALFVVGAGPVLSVVGHLTSGLGGMVSTVGQAATAFSLWRENGHDLANAMAETVIPTMTDAAKRAELVADKTEAMRLSMANLAVGGAVTASIAVIALLVEQIKTAIEHENDLRTATEGLESSFANMSQSIDDSYAAKLGESFEMTAREIENSADDLLNSQMQLANDVNDALSTIGADSAMLDQYVRTMDELSEKTNLSAEDQAKLESAVKGYNDIVGTSISIIDGQNGKLNANRDAIHEVAEAYKEYAKTQAIMDEYDKIQRQLVQNQMEQAKYADVLKDGYQDLSLAQNLLNGTTIEQMDAAMKAKNAMADAKRQEDSLRDSLSILDKMMGGTTSTTGDFEEAINSLGEASGRTASSMTADAEDYAESIEEAADASEDAITALKRAQEDAYTAAKRAYEDDYSNLKAELDSRYDAQKSAFDQEYSNLKTELDRQKTEWERSYKDAYDLRKFELSKQTDLLKDELDKQVKAIQSANAAALKSMKAEHSKEESDLKDYLDSLYKERKKSYDSEVKEAQKKNKKILADAKKSNEAETESFKEATKKRVAEIKKEYEARIKALEANDGTKEIDKRIKALKAETEAEREAAKRKEQEEKKSELQAAVDKAKTRKTREKAEKALADYLEEIAQEQREAERERLIDSLEDQKDQIKEKTKLRKSELEDERDERIDAYQKRRDEELSAIKDRQDAVYDALSEKLTEQLDLQREHNSTALDEYRATLDEQLDSMKSSHAAEQEQLSADNAAMVEQVKAANAERISEVKAANDAELAEMARAHEIEADNLKLANDAILANEKSKHENVLSMTKSANEERLKILKRTNEDALKNLKRNQEDAVKALKDGGGEAVKTTSKSASKVSSTVAGATKDISDKSSSLKKLMGDDARAIGASLIKSASEAKRSVTGEVSSATSEMERNLDSFSTKADVLGDKATTNYNTGLERGAANIRITTAGIGNGVEQDLTYPANNSESWGWDMLINFTNGINNAWNQFANPAISGIANFIADMIGHSKPKKGPLRDDDVWMYHMMQNLERGIERGKPLLERSIGDITTMVQEELAESNGNLVLAGQFDVDGLREQGAEFVNAYRNVLTDIQMATREHDSRMSAYVGDYGRDISFETASITRSVTDAITSAVSGAMARVPATVVVEKMVVRDESDIKRVSRELRRLQTSEERRSLRK